VARHRVRAADIEADLRRLLGSVDEGESRR